MKNNAIVFSEYSFEEYVSRKDEFEKSYEYIDARSMSKNEIETRWQYEDFKCFFLGTNGLPNLYLDKVEQVWIFDLTEEEPYYNLSKFNDIERFNIENSNVAYKHFKSGRFGGLRDWKWSDYMQNNIWNARNKNNESLNDSERQEL